jgi:hypothetical protein
MRGELGTDELACCAGYSCTGEADGAGEQVFGTYCTAGGGGAPFIATCASGVCTH